MRITFYPMVFMMITTALHIILSFIFVTWLDMGIVGLAWSMTIKDGVLMVMTMIYCSYSSKVRHILLPYDNEVWRGWGEYLSISLPATAMVCAEWWASYVMAILAGVLGVVDLASFTIMVYISTLLNLFSIGV